MSALHEVEQKNPDEFVYPQDIAVAGSTTLMRYGGLTKREYFVAQIANGIVAYCVANNVAPQSVGSNACIIADAVLAALANENVAADPIGEQN
jgi:hypothetical protein